MIQKILFLVYALLVPMIPAFSADLAGCQPQLEAAICYGLPTEHWAMTSEDLVQNLKSFQERKCRPTPVKIKQTLIDIYQRYPKEIQQAFCAIKKVFITSGDVSFGALADYYFDVSSVKAEETLSGHFFSGRPVGFVLEISEKNRFKGESASAYVTRVFQARFGKAPKKSPHIPTADYETPFAENGALATTIVHEIGHMLARSHKVTSTYFLPFSESKWSKISFKLDGDYYLRHANENLLMDIKSKLLSDRDVMPITSFLKKSGLATLYGATSPQEDFAEFFMLMYYGNLKWKIGGQTILDFQGELKTNESFKAKAEIIKNLMSLPAPFSLQNRGTVSGEIGVM
jgi:hypothetical protein